MKTLYVIFINLLGIVLGQSPIKIVLVRQNDQEEMVQWFETSLKSLDSKSKYEWLPVEVMDTEEDYSNICESFTNGATSLLDITWPGSDIAKEICKEMNVPYLKVDVSISPILSFLDKFLDFRNSTDVSLIFDNPNNIDQSLYFWIDTTRLRMVVSEDLDEDSAKRLRELRPTPNNFAIIASTESMNNLFETALKEDLVSLPERWNLVFTDFKFSNFDKTLEKRKPINLLKLNEQVCCTFLKQMPCKCPEDFNLQVRFSLIATEAFLSILEQENIKLSNTLECNQTENGPELVDNFMKQLNLITMNSSIIFNDHGVLRPKVTGVIEVTSNGSNEILAEFQDDQIKVVSGKNIKAIKAFYRVGITHALPWSYKEYDKKTGQTYWTGYCADFAQKLSELMNFDFEFVEPKVGTFGEKVSGVWNGVIGDLASGETDIAITAIVMTADREEVVDFVAPYFEQTGITIVMRKPVRKTSLFKFMTVLKLEVWLSIVGALIVTGFMVWFLDKYSPYSARNNRKAYPYACREFTLKESFWFALTSFTPQGGGEAPKALSGRTLVAAYWLFVVLMLATFTANLAAFLTVERMQAPVQSLEQLARQSRINYTVVQNSDSHQYFINMKHAEDTLYRMWKELTLNASTDDTQYRVWDYPIREQYGHILLAINDSNPVANASEGFRMVDEHLDADFAFIHDSSEIRYEISKNCNFTEVGEVFAEKPYAVAVQQGSHLQDEISKMILTLQKDRYFEQLQAKYWNHSAKGNCPSTDDNEGITLESLGGVFIATLFGLALAMVTLVGEVLYYRRKRKATDAKVTKLKELEFSGKSMPIMPGKIILHEKYPIKVGQAVKPLPSNNKTKIEAKDNVTHVSLYPRARNRINHTQIYD